MTDIRLLHYNQSSGYVRNAKAMLISSRWCTKIGKRAKNNSHCTITDIKNYVVGVVSNLVIMTHRFQHDEL